MYGGVALGILQTRYSHAEQPRWTNGPLVVPLMHFPFTLAGPSAQYPQPSCNT